MKKLTFIFAIILSVSFFLTSCTSGSGEFTRPMPEKQQYSGTEMYLNEPPETLYGKDESWEMVSNPANVVTVIKGDNLWDLAQQCGGNPYAWEEIYFMNQPALAGRLEYRDLGDSLGLRPWVWIYPGEELKVPTYFSCSRLQYVEYVEQFEYYRPTDLPVKLVEPVPGIDAQKILLLDKNQKAASPVVDPIRQGGAGIFTIFLPIFEFMLGIAAFLGLMILALLLAWMLRELIIWISRRFRKGRGEDNDHPAHNPPTGQARSSTSSESESKDYTQEMAFLNKHLEILQKTGGSSEVYFGDVQAKFQIPENKTGLNVETQPKSEIKDPVKVKKEEDKK